jgi:hypothetical protein
LHHLNDTSAELLESLDSSMFLAVRISTICLVNDPKEMKFFKLIVAGLKYTETPRLNVFEEAIRRTQTEGHPVSLKLLKECIGLVQKADMSTKENKFKLSSITLNEWSVNCDENRQK